MLTATTMPSAIEEVGGLELISWTFALYLAGSIAAAACMAFLVGRRGFRNTMIGAALVYCLGCMLIASAPGIAYLLAGRWIQGIGGGGMIALVYSPRSVFFQPNGA